VTGNRRTYSPGSPFYCGYGCSRDNGARLSELEKCSILPSIGQRSQIQSARAVRPAYREGVSITEADVNFSSDLIGEIQDEGLAVTK